MQLFSVRVILIHIFKNSCQKFLPNSLNQPLKAFCINPYICVCIFLTVIDTFDTVPAKEWFLGNWPLRISVGRSYVKTRPCLSGEGIPLGQHQPVSRVLLKECSYNITNSIGKKHLSKLSSSISITFLNVTFSCVIKFGVGRGCGGDGN